ncbi:epidermal growth factor receptor substrate 15-like 1 [Cervus canadensis]|uniref:epidermal growth factor receptor substrate 15-like 1 n=1 Tax=Cervus canadensis TaxID=1574408 RepID=UPI001CA36672|nr:epidermal growth factor receptor substrate 15-like 1 [Cervus canadensis]
MYKDFGTLDLPSLTNKHTHNPSPLNQVTHASSLFLAWPPDGARKIPWISTDPFGGDPFKESDPFRGSTPDDFFKKQTKSDPFTSDPFTKNPSLPSKLDPFESSDPFSSSSVSSKGSGPFGALDPFGSGSFNSAEGFADFSQMSKCLEGVTLLWELGR